MADRTQRVILDLVLQYGGVTSGATAAIAELKRVQEQAERTHATMAGSKSSSTAQTQSAAIKAAAAEHSATLTALRRFNQESHDELSRADGERLATIEKTAARSTAARQREYQQTLTALRRFNQESIEEQSRADAARLAASDRTARALASRQLTIARAQAEAGAARGVIAGGGTAAAARTAAATAGRGVGLAAQGYSQTEIASIQAAKAEVAGLRGESNLLGTTLKRAGTLLTAIAGIEIAGGIRRGVHEFFAFNSQIEQARLGIAQTVGVGGRLTDVLGQPLRPAQQVALALLDSDRALRLMLEDSIRLGVPIQDIQHAYSVTAGTFKGANVPLQDAVHITEGLALLANQVGIPFNVLARDIRDVASGLNINRTILGSILGLSQAEVQAARQRGELQLLLNERLEVAFEAQRQNLHTFEGLINSIGSSLRGLSLGIGADAFKELETAARGFREEIERLRADPGRQSTISRGVTAATRFGIGAAFVAGKSIEGLASIPSVVSALANDPDVAARLAAARGLPPPAAVLPEAARRASLTTAGTQLEETDALARRLREVIREQGLGVTATEDFKVHLQLLGEEVAKVEGGPMASFAGRLRKIFEELRNSSLGFTTFSTEFRDAANKLQDSEVRLGARAAARAAQTAERRARRTLTPEDIAALSGSRAGAVQAKEIEEIDTLLRGTNIGALPRDPELRRRYAERIAAGGSSAAAIRSLLEEVSPEIKRLPVGSKEAADVQRTATGLVGNVEDIKRDAAEQLALGRETNRGLVDQAGKKVEALIEAQRRLDDAKRHSELADVQRAQRSGEARVALLKEQYQLLTQERAPVSDRAALLERINEIERGTLGLEIEAAKRTEDLARSEERRALAKETFAALRGDQTALVAAQTEAQQAHDHIADAAGRRLEMEERTAAALAQQDVQLAKLQQRYGAIAGVSELLLGGGALDSRLQGLLDSRGDDLARRVQAGGASGGFSGALDALRGSGGATGAAGGADAAGYVALAFRVAKLVNDVFEFTRERRRNVEAASNTLGVTRADLIDANTKGFPIVGSYLNTGNTLTNNLFGRKIGGEINEQLLMAGVPVAGPFLGALGVHLFQPPTGESQLNRYTTKYLDQIGLNYARFVLPGDRGLNFRAANTRGGPQLTVPDDIRALGGETSTAGSLFALQLSGTKIPEKGWIGNRISNFLTNVTAGLKLSKEEADKFVLTFARPLLGSNFDESLLKLENFRVRGKITNEQFASSAELAIRAFNTDLPKAIDTTRLAMDALTASGRTNFEALKREIEDATKSFSAGATSALDALEKGAGATAAKRALGAAYSDAFFGRINERLLQEPAIGKSLTAASADESAAAAALARGDTATYRALIVKLQKDYAEGSAAFLRIATPIAAAARADARLFGVQASGAVENQTGLGARLPSFKTDSMTTVPGFSIGAPVLSWTHVGEKIYNPAYHGDMISELRALREEVRSLKASMQPTVIQDQTQHVLVVDGRVLARTEENNGRLQRVGRSMPDPMLSVTR